MTEICHPEWITVTADGSAHKGYDQDWYPEKRQQISGCGPTVGSMMAAYTQRKLEKKEITTKDGADGGIRTVVASDGTERSGFREGKRSPGADHGEIGGNSCLCVI